MIPATVFTLAGLFGFGYAVTAGDSVYLIAFIWGTMLMGITIAAIATSSYALDAFRDNSTEIFIMAMVFKNFFFYGLSNFINNWIASSGAIVVFDVMGGISAALVRSFIFFTDSSSLRLSLCTYWAKSTEAFGIDIMCSRCFIWRRLSLVPLRRVKLLCLCYCRVTTT
jgi:hypothetical protein